MSILIVTLPPSMPAAATPCSVVWSDDGRTIKRHLDTPLSLLPDTPDAEIVVMVPVQRLSWHQVELPKGTLERGFFQDGNTQRLRSVLEGLLEECMLDEPAQVHFALAPDASTGAPTWVATCDRAWLGAWLNTLEQAGRPVSRIVPELNPRAADNTPRQVLHALGTTDQAHLVCCDDHGVTVLPLNQVSVQLLGQNFPHDSTLQVVAEPAVAELAEQYFSGQVTLQTAPQRALAAAQTAWDLAQFELLRTRGTRTRKRLATLGAALLHAPQWRPARWAAIAIVGINLVGLQAWAWREQAALSAKRATIRNVLTNTFPDVRVVVDAPVQMAKSLADLQRRNGVAVGGDLEAMLGQLQSLAPDVAAPTAIEFAAGTLQLKLPDPASPAVVAAMAKLQANGYIGNLEGDRLVLKQVPQP